MQSLLYIYLGAFTLGPLPVIFAIGRHVVFWRNNATEVCHGAARYFYIAERIR